MSAETFPLAMEKVPLLDHGYIRLVEVAGSDRAIIEAARMSTDKGFLGWGPIPGDGECEKCRGSGMMHPDGTPFVMNDPLPDDTFKLRVCSECLGDGRDRVEGDERLLRYLYKNAHSTPFEFGWCVIEVQAPIFVFREWHRHRTQSYSEVSARYTPLPEFSYVPSVERLMMNAGTGNKQAGTVKGAKPLTEEYAHKWRERIRTEYAADQDFYEEGLENGIPKELARVGLPVGRYTRMRAAANLRNWLGFMTLRSAPNAQWEIRQYSLELGNLLRKVYPKTMHLFDGGE